ncbi:hypothetical protein [Paraburkholderia sp. HD33-4]|uniref:hypothetical protein n=1 Tax=Paraburkholderia sp. HD33-4 TaxID=2883242 RepID=UPI001F445FE1|nr:hypothetical protein [Paraburkholderia sp. HD33-4]
MGNMNEYEFEQELQESGLETAGEFGEGEGVLGAMGSVLAGDVLIRIAEAGSTVGSRLQPALRGCAALVARRRSA